MKFENALSAMKVGEKVTHPSIEGYYLQAAGWDTWKTVLLHYIHKPGRSHPHPIMWIPDPVIMFLDDWEVL